MRLIDADKLYLHLNDWALAESPTGFEVGEAKLERETIYQTIMYCMKAVDDQPTAYDVDKVIDEMEGCVFRVDFADGDNCMAVELDEAIGIVKDGGKV